MAKLPTPNPSITGIMKMTPEKLGDEAQSAAIKSAQRPRLSLLGIGGLAAFGVALTWSYMTWRKKR